MADQQRAADLAPLYARLAAQDAELAAQRGELARLTRRRRLPRRLVPLALVALLVALLPLSLLAAGPFGDLNAGSPHNGNIQAIADAGITKGCDPPAFVSYCPSANVTREEMASFLARTAGLGGNPPVANALTAVSATSATTAASAGNAAQLGGQPPSFYQPAGQPIANATNAVNATSAGNAATVGGLAPAQLARVAAGQGTAGLTGSYKDIATATIVAPTAGYVAVTASAMGYTTATSGCPCLVVLALRDNVAGTSGNAIPFYATVYNPAAGGSAHAGLASTWVFPVAAGPRTFAARLARQSGSAAVNADAALTLVFSPYADAPADGFGAGSDPPQP